MPTNTTAIGVGAIKRIQVVVKSTAGTATNSAHRFRLEKPNGTVTSWTTGSASTASSQHVGTGTYRFDRQTTAAGNYWWEFQSTGTIIHSTGGTFAVYSRKTSS